MTAKPRLRLLVLDTLNHRALVVWRYPGQKIAAVIRWLPLTDVLIRDLESVADRLGVA